MISGDPARDGLGALVKKILSAGRPFVKKLLHRFLKLIPAADGMSAASGGKTIFLNFSLSGTP